MVANEHGKTGTRKWPALRDATDQPSRTAGPAKYALASIDDLHIPLKGLDGPGH